MRLLRNLTFYSLPPDTSKNFKKYSIVSAFISQIIGVEKEVITCLTKLLRDYLKKTIGQSIWIKKLF